MKRFFFIWIIALASCAESDEQSKYPRWVGDSEFIPEIDSVDIEVCNGENSVLQYFHFDEGLQYRGEKKELRRIYTENYQPVDTDQSGLIRIRFIVNCKGETGRFRIMGSDLDYREQIFDERITDQLLEITKSLDGWNIQSRDEIAQDYYQYLIFKIDRGNLIEIMP
jgi:hypothetical protein